MVDGATRQALQEAQTELYRAQVTMLELRTVLQDLWDHAQYEIYFRMLSIYRTTLQHIYRAAFDIQAQQEYRQEYHHHPRYTPMLQSAYVAYEEIDTL